MGARVPPVPVAIARIGIGVAAAMTAIEGYGFLAGIEAGRIAVPFAEWVPRPTSASLLVLLTVSVAAGLALTLGTHASAAAALSVMCELVIFAWDQQTYSSHRLLVTLLCLYLVFAESDAALSIAARIRGRGAGVPFWPQLLMMSLITAVYLFAGLSKINPVFLQGVVLEKEITVGLPPGFFPLLAVATVVTEIFLAFALWLRRVRLVAVVVGILLHVSIVVMLREPTALFAFALACASLYPLFLARPSLGSLAAPAAADDSVTAHSSSSRR